MELRGQSQFVQGPWILGGDFNLVRWLVDRYGDLRSFTLMSLFNDLIRDMQVIDIPLKNRLFTWSSKRPEPVFSKLDRIFVSTEWSQMFPSITLTALDMVVSDHVPLLMTCKQTNMRRPTPRLEVFWFGYPEVRQMVSQIWQENNALGSMGRSNSASFEHKAESMHKELTKWHESKHGRMEVQLENCKQAIIFFDTIEDRRPLDRREFGLRIKLREKAFELANNMEMKWQQRARCRWLYQGDGNTRFFHAFASARLRKNAILELQVEEGITINREDHIKQVFSDHLKAVLGTEGTTLGFDPTRLYPDQQDLSYLQNPFSEGEVERAVRQLAKNKASGPDGLPNEFAQIYWEEVKDEIMDLIIAFYNHVLDLKPINRGNVIMIPKKEGANSVHDFRPISVINLVPKIISKMLANRLRRALPDLISPYQTAFVKGRFIAENFIATRELLHHVTGSKRPALLAKIDFSKAFDSIQWFFLIKVMHARGFPEKWIRWISAMLCTASSRVVINGDRGEYFMHKRGLRQGDPLSPMLFIIAVDVLQRMIGAGNEMLDDPISNRVQKAVVAMQYADDTAFILNGNPVTMITFKLVLRLFTKISGLTINYEKSNIVTFGMDQAEVEMASAIIGCEPTELPITYIGMPLTVRKSGRSAYMPLIEKLEKKFQGWRCKIISRGGRLQLVTSVLSSIPIYFMSSFKLPKWVIKRLDRIRRDFLWGKNDGARGISLINWPTVCLPKELGE